MAASLAQDGRGPSPLCPLVSAHIPRVGRPRHQKHAPASLGKRESRPGPRGVWRGRNHQVSSRWGGKSGQSRRVALHAELAILGDVWLGRGFLGTRSWKGLGQGPRGQGRARSPWRGALALVQVPGPKADAECHQSCQHTILHALGLSQGNGGQRPQYGLHPESEQRTARAGSLQSRWPRG